MLIKIHNTLVFFIHVKTTNFACIDNWKITNSHRSMFDNFYIYNSMEDPRFPKRGGYMGKSSISQNILSHFGCQI